MPPIALAGLSLIQFAVLARLVFFDSWEEFKLAFQVVGRPARTCAVSGEAMRARFASAKLALLVFFTAVLAGLTYVVVEHL